MIQKLNAGLSQNKRPANSFKQDNIKLCFQGRYLAAKGGGLSSLFGGGVQSSLSGSTVVEKNLDRLTYFVTGIWLVSIIGVALQIKYQ